MSDQLGAVLPAIMLALLIVSLSAGGAEPMPDSPHLGDLATFRESTSHRSSSYDVTGGNADYWWIEAGQARDILNVQGAGCVTHIWMTTPSILGSGSWYQGSLETTTIRMYWDGEETPSVDAPLGIFFCAPFDTAREFESLPIVLGPLDGRGFNMYFPMPFAESARIELVNHSAQNRFRVYFHVDYVLYEGGQMPPNQARFHAGYHREDPLTRGQNYVLLDTQGRGHYVGTVLALDTGFRGDREAYGSHDWGDEYAWWWEGDDMIYVDGELALHGTGTEDYFGTSWSYADAQAFTAPQFGCTMNGYDPRHYGRWCLYRWHISDPIAFTESIRVSIEHGHGNEFVLAPYQSVAYWYQQEPHVSWESFVPTEADISEPVPPVE